MTSDNKLPKIGVDMVYLPRLQKRLKDPHFLKRILTENEIALMMTHTSESRQLEFLGGRYAAKEAYMKAKGRGIDQTSFHEFEVLRNPSGMPCSNLGSVSISHDGDYAIAMVVIA